MASLVTDVLLCTDLLEKEDLGTRISKLSAQIDEVKGEIYHAIHEKYTNYRPMRDSTVELHGRVTTLSKDMVVLSNKIKGDINDQLNRSTGDLQDLTSQLEKTNAIVDVLETLCKMNGLFKDFQSAIQNEECLKAAEIISVTKSDLEALLKDGYCDLKIVKALRSELRESQETLLHYLGEAWSSKITWNLNQPKEATSSADIKQVQLKIVHNDNAQCVVTAMHHVGILHKKLQMFGKRLLDNVLRPLVLFPAAKIRINTAEKLLMIRFKTPVKTSKHPTDPVSLYKLLVSVLDALSAPLLSLRTTADTEATEGPTLMTVLGDLLWPELSECIVSNSLVHSIPTSSSKLKEYKGVITATEEFEAALRKLGFIAAEVAPLLTYARDVNVHFANKKCRDLLVEARELMKRELYNTKRVGTPRPTTKGKKNTASEDKNYVSVGIFALPECAVSESVDSLVHLAYQTLKESSNITPQCAIQLFCTVRNMFEMFVDVVPIYHRDSLQDLPQVSALHHNNCMYIAHHLLTLGHQYRNSLPSPLNEGMCTFVDLVPVFRKLSSDCFLAQMRKQRDQLVESLSAAGTFDAVSTDDNSIVCERAIKQVLHQLSHLQRVWSDVLPNDVYTQVVSTLVNTALTHIIEKITSLEDISADDAHQLFALLSRLSDRIPELIRPVGVEEPVVVQSTVNHWTSFTELLFILEASMQDIVDRWADGKGPLVAVFTPTEVKGLIRAIFQNTDRRAAALAKIRQDN